MSTLIYQLREIAAQCKTSDEFTKRAKDYIKNVSKIDMDLMEDGELREIYRKVDYKRKVDEAWEKYDNTIKPMLKKRTDCKGLWYETWIDLSETWIDKWFSAFQFMSDEEIVNNCAKYLNEQQRFYDSPDYYDMLNNMVKIINEE